ncbi:purine-binding chemotaxis protein CheW [Roseomonas sp. PWR1]|uniref:Chemotaxis protein CheW n=1 Tax=Roseomonas nitratireducens TaxID=2820810 RepID=A0ABS4ARE5_9PROT|nr:chemotaxis protein CheW [Neoroseomonas nitratireducens]MBP0463928.1 purine-binding chemotaxis protein CheW [Neoroseomonas nitratireducens]
MSATAEAPDAGAAAEGRQFVTFQVEREIFGVPLAEVQEIIRMPELVQVPLAPPSLEGIANLRGAVLPVSSLRRVFGCEGAAHDDATRVVVVRLGDRPAGFVVDRMASVVTAEAGEIEDATTIEATVRSDLLRGVVKREAGLIQLLDPARLLTLDGMSQRSGTAGGGTAGLDEAQDAAVPEDDVQLVSFAAAGEEYALPIEEVQEIVQLPGAVTRVPQARSHVVGVITLRERLLPLVSLRRIFGLPEGDLGESCRVLVVSPDGAAGASIGIVMDQVKEVLRVPRGLVEPVPPLLAGEEDGWLEGICRLEQGRRLVTILSARRMFHDASLRSAVAEVTGGEAADEGAMDDEGAAGRISAEDEEQVVVFRLAGEEYGVPIGAVQEIVRVPDALTHIPRTPDFIEGVVNLRGAVLPVVDQRRRFALPAQDRNDRQRIMVLQIGGMRTGFIVDQVSEVLKIPHGAIERTPHLSEAQARLIRRVANLPAQRRMLLLIDPGDLLEAREIEALEAA